VEQLGVALIYAHRCGVVHADVKPANVMIMPTGQVKLFDFGVARIRQKQSETVTKFDPAVLGAVTPAYSSMQVLTGEDPTAADDIFSLACLFYRLIAGYRVFGPRNAAEAAESGMEPQRPQGLRTVQWKALKKALAYSRVARYAEMQEFVDDLKSDEIEENSSLSVGDPMVEADDSESPRRWLFGLAAVLLLAAVAWVGTQTNLLDDYWSESAAEDEPLAARESVSDSGVETNALDGNRLTPDSVALPAAEELSAAADGDAATIVLGTSDTDLLIEPLDELLIDEASATGDAEAVAADTQVSASEPAVDASEAIRPVDTDNEEFAKPLAEIAVADLIPENDPVLVEMNMPVNTVVFWLDQVVVRESDSAVQIDVLRVNPDSQAFEVGYSVTDTGATQGEDYFLPGATTLYFAADQTTVRLLIPLVQDSAIEADESFVLEINAAVTGGDTNINRRITVMIQDDDIAAQ
jgi:hypothetical protein